VLVNAFTFAASPPGSHGDDPGSLAAYQEGGKRAQGHLADQDAPPNPSKKRSKKAPSAPHNRPEPIPEQLDLAGDLSPGVLWEVY
jgi:hypothetical protein